VEGDPQPEEGRPVHHRSLRPVIRVPIDERGDRGHQGLSTYLFVREGPFETEVKVVSGEGGLDLVSTRDVLSRNNLLNLPAC
jgi:hypothetical protein